MANKKETVKPVKVEVEPKIGAAVNCDRLRVRTKPSDKSKTLYMIDRGTNVLIDETFNHEMFYKVSLARIEDGVVINGYCMKKFIGFKQGD